MLYAHEDAWWQALIEHINTLCSLPILTFSEAALAPPFLVLHKKSWLATFQDVRVDFDVHLMHVFSQEKPCHDVLNPLCQGLRGVVVLSWGPLFLREVKISRKLKDKKPQEMILEYTGLARLKIPKL